jgi:NitT/TauT family transport system substrate-binding protein
MLLRILVSRHSAFYSPLIATLAGPFLKSVGLEASYGVLPPQLTSREALLRGEADVIQSAVSSSFGPLERGITGLPVHFAQINQRDGFFLVGRKQDPEFQWRTLEKHTLLADHAGQPLAMLRYALRHQGVDLARVRWLDAGSPEQIATSFRLGVGDYVHLQGPAAHQLAWEGIGSVVASVGEAMPPVAFSSLTATREFVEGETGQRFLQAYTMAREWVRTAPAVEIAWQEAAYFPGIAEEALAAAISEYQKLGCWEGETGISPELYEQALNVFEVSGAITRRHPYQSVVWTPGSAGGTFT